jgi:hypothetical protein
MDYLGKIVLENDVEIADVRMTALLRADVRLCEMYPGETNVLRHC